MVVSTYQTEEGNEIMTLIDILFIGMGLAVDASCVSTSNGLLYKPNIMNTVKIGFVFAVFQGVMPLIGYFGVGVLSFELLEYNHFVALILLSVLGVKMIYDAQKESHAGDEICGEAENVDKEKKLTGGLLLIQAVTTSIDALSVGITFHNYDRIFVMYAVLLIAIVTFVMCAISVRVGIEVGTKLNTKAELIGGLVLVLLGIKIFIAR